MVDQQEDTKVTFTAEQQTFIDKLIGDARVKARSKAETDLAAETAKEKAKQDADRLVADKEFEKLSLTQASRITKLEGFEAQVKAYGELITGMLKDRVKALGKDAQKAIDALPDSLTELEKLNWLNKNESLFQAAGDGVGTSKPAKKTKPKKVKPTEISKRPIRL